MLMKYLAQNKAVPALEMPVPNEIIQLVNNLKQVFYLKILMI